MESKSEEVSRLLNYAAAMSAAQEKVTGNSKLDMAAIMAALAMAKSDSDAREGRQGALSSAGQKSFLHNKFKQTEVREELISSKQFMIEDVMRNNKVTRSEMSHHINKTDITENNMTNNCYENVIPRFNKNPVNHPHKSTADETDEAGKAPALPPRNAAMNNIFANKLHMANSSNAINAAKNPSAAMNDDLNCSTLSKSCSRDPCQVKSTQNNGGTKETDHAGVSSMSPLKSSIGVARFINHCNTNTTKDIIHEKSENIHRAERVDLTETERVDLTETDSVKKTMQMFEKSQQKQNNYATNKEFSDIKLPSNEKVTKTDPMMNQFLSVVEKLSAEKERETGNGRLDMSELVTALQNFKEPALIKSQENFQNYNHSSTFSDEGNPVPPVSSHLEIKVPSIQGLLSSASAGPKFSQTNFKPLPSKIVPRQETAKTIPSHSVAQTETVKHSSLKPTHNHASSSNLTSQHANNFSDEKNSLMGELKTKLCNSDDSDFAPVQTTMTKRNFTVNNNPEQVVNKIVYNQYREMLNSYRNNK